MVIVMRRFAFRGGKHILSSSPGNLGRVIPLAMLSVNEEGISSMSILAKDFEVRSLE